jgi:hypothetical protein
MVSSRFTTRTMYIFIIIPLLLLHYTFLNTFLFVTLLKLRGYDFEFA